MATNHDGPTGTRERDTAPAGADAAPTPTADTAVTVEVVPLDTLTPLTDNPRTHTSRGIDFLKASLGRVGAARSGVIDEARTILAGNGMQDAATHVGYREAVVVTTDGTRPVFVQRTGLSTTQKARLIVDDNRASELSAWNPTLATYADQDPSLKADWTRPEWRAAVGRDAPTAGRTDPDATPVARSTSIRLGDQFRLQAHVVRCGDSTDPAHVDALLGGATPHLMPTDPPYGVNYAPEWRAHVSTWCVERAIAAATLQGVPGARPGDCVVGLLCMVMQPPEPVATDQAGRRRAHAASWLPRLRHRRGQAPWPHACGASTGRLIADALCPPDPRRSGTVSHDRTAMRCRAADLGWPVSQWCHQETLDPHGWLTEDEVTRKRRERSRTMWASEDELPEPRTEGRAIDPAAVERMFDATRGAHVSPGELEHLWHGQPGPPAGAWYCTGIDWAQKRDSTVAAVVRCETTPLQLVAVYRTQRRPWPIMTAQVGSLLDAFPGPAAHDATGAGNAMGAFPALAAHDQLQGVTLVGRVRTDLFRHDIGAIERHEIVCPRIDVFYTEHLYCGEDDLFGSGHPPETVVALALAYHAFTTGRRPIDATPARAPAGETR